MNQKEMIRATEDTLISFVDIAAIGSLIIVFGLLVLGFLNEPTVAVSWETKICKYVEFSDGHREDYGDLSRLGGYEQIWVK